ncbi:MULTISPECIES: esterase [unclassified Devosia]|uniref:phosphotriesterase family protein n=1 Tax=unclassified Devosia TaxID=196773 RepID=UPI00086E0179|nr:MULTISPECIES: esterase [unclassified Devosia]MBN9362420.1 esterase [Devosia sp.]ODS86820.1 MAG: esterase [Devosia sp. SCN 66-27]OJX24348.1 MAG: esterase [Devosia sp. 66-14]
MKLLHTTLGPKRADELGMILPHEHVFVDLRTPDQPGYAEADPAEVVRVMRPQIEAIKARGVTALVECSTGGVGLRVDIDLAVSQATGLPIVVPTGNYREPWIPDWVREASEADLEAQMFRDLAEGVGDTGVKAAWIKLSAGDDGITPLEAKILRAAARAAQRTGAVIGSHTIKGRVVMDQLDIIEAEGYRADRFISIHTQEEKDFGLNIAVAQRGAWIEYDHVGRAPDAAVSELILRALDADLGSQLLLSHDRGWYDPAIPGGGVPTPYTHLSDVMLPLLRTRGVDEAVIRQLTVSNPFEAYAR